MASLNISPHAVIFVEYEFWYHNTEEFLSHFCTIHDIISIPWDLADA